jgi:hypothetical protein
MMERLLREAEEAQGQQHGHAEFTEASGPHYADNDHSHPEFATVLASAATIKYLRAENRSLGFRLGCLTFVVLILSLVVALMALNVWL